MSCIGDITPNCSIFAQQVESTKQTFQLTRLRPLTQYTVQLYVVYEGGAKSKPSKIAFKTGQVQPDGEWLLRYCHMIIHVVKGKNFKVKVFCATEDLFLTSFILYTNGLHKNIIASKTGKKRSKFWQKNVFDNEFCVFRPCQVRITYNYLGY